MSKFLILLFTVAGIGVANAECYMRSATVSIPKTRIDRVSDLERNVMPDENGSLCRVTFRALINGEWHDAEGEAVAKKPAQACAQATDLGRISILTEVSGNEVQGRQEMICTDKPKPTVRSAVNIGDSVLDSEVSVHPGHTASFYYRGNVCRWFTEAGLYQGIICRSPDQTTWKVVDKW
jgi:hypothetical protein